MKKGRVQYNFRRCGRKPWVITREVGKFLVKTLLKLRRKSVCTAPTLQAELYKHKKIWASTPAIRKHLRDKGFKWKPRSQKRRYDKAKSAKRKSFSDKYKDMSQEKISKEISMAMDGVVLTVAPTNPTERLNFCLNGETHMYRRDDEANSPELAGADDYPDQVPISRAVPLWGAISASGFHEICFHKKRKLNRTEWLKDAVKNGNLFAAVKKLQPGSHKGRRGIICDSESFMKGKECKREYKKKMIVLVHIPSKSPDLNPIESFWGWLRQAMRRKDLEDYRLGRPALGKMAWKRRLRNLLRSKHAQTVARKKFQNFKKVCKIVSKAKGAHSGQ